MATIGQIEANRENARHSTGPCTAAGKAVSAQNATKHGLTSRQVLAAGESADELEEFRRRLQVDLGPAGPLEEALVEVVGDNVWRLRRLRRIEAELLSTGEEQSIGRVFATRDRSLQTLLRYESSLGRGLYRALHELHRRQAVRAGEQVSPPVAVDLDVTVRPGGFDVD